MIPPSSLHAFLAKARVPYTVVPHRTAFSAQAEAASLHVPGRDWAKVVIFVADGKPIQAVLAAPFSVNLRRLATLAGAGSIRFALDHELRALFPDCEPGAMPPFGPLYGQRVFVDAALAAEPEIVFSAGTHSAAIRMRYADFAAATRPVVGRFAERPRQETAKLASSSTSSSSGTALAHADSVHQ
jgi:Ala-tRNA(Pro) deacylase